MKFTRFLFLITLPPSIYIDNSLNKIPENIQVLNKTRNLSTKISSINVKAYFIYLIE